MQAIERALATARASFTEVKENAIIRYNFDHFFVANARELFQSNDIQPGTRKALNNALQLKVFDSTPVYRGLSVILTAAFELFIKSVIVASLETRCNKVVKYSDLSEKLRVRHIANASRVLSFASGGSIFGRPYDFASLIKDLGRCFSDAPKFNLHNDVFITPLGNCTSHRLTELFKEADLKPPFDDKLGAMKIVQDWRGRMGAREACKSIAYELDKLISLRNDIAHGAATASVTHNEIAGYSDLLHVLTAALAERVEQEIS